MKQSYMLFAIIGLFLAVAIAVGAVSGQEQKNGRALTSLPEVVIVPTLENEHQFNLDYTVAHLATLLDIISPNAILINDYTEWLRRNCPWNTTSPEVHIALGYAHERSVPIFGTSLTPSYTYEATAKFTKEFREKYPDPRSGARVRLDSMTAAIARDYSFTSGGRELQVLLNRVFRSKLAELTQQQRDSLRKRSQQIAEEIERLAASHASYRRWGIVLWWGYALFVEEALRDRKAVRVVPINTFLPLKPAAIEKRMDYKNTAWILAGVLDEWYGMWAPQVLPGGRIATLLARLKRLAPGDPVTEFLEARWLLQNRDYKAAEPILERLINTAESAKFPFPLNGKWIRPPWSSVRDKAKLNLAFVYDYKGERNKALNLYRELLELGDQLNDDARASGYTYDDIQSVIESYTKAPYTGMPDEAFRHFPLTAKVPSCAPDASRK